MNTGSNLRSISEMRLMRFMREMDRNDRNERKMIRKTKIFPT